jgi:hypothetical protein
MQTALVQKVEHVMWQPNALPHIRLAISFDTHFVKAIVFSNDNWQRNMEQPKQSNSSST